MNEWAPGSFALAQSHNSGLSRATPPPRPGAIRGKRLLDSFADSLLPATLAFHNRNVAVDGQFRESFDFSTRIWPFHFEPIDLFSLAQTQHQARIVGGEITSSAKFPRVPQQIPGLVSHFCS